MLTSPTERISGAGRTRESFPRVLLACMWAASVAILLLEDRGTAFNALGFGEYTSQSSLGLEIRVERSDK